MKKMLASAVLVAALIPISPVASQELNMVGMLWIDRSVKGPDGTVYTLTNDGKATKRPYTSAGAFLSYGFNSFGAVESVTEQYLQNYTTGSFIPPRDGNILCADRGQEQGTCYLMSNGQKLGFTSEQVFRELGFNFDHALYGDVSFVPAGSNIGKIDEAHRPGVLVNKDGTIYLVGTNGLLGIPNKEVFDSWGYSFIHVVTANSFDRNLPITGNITNRRPGELNPATTGLQTPQPASVKVLAPNGGEVFKTGSSYRIQWDVPDGVARVQITLMKVFRCPYGPDTPCPAIYSEQVKTIGESILAGPGYLDWAVPPDLETGEYYFSIADVSGQAWLDESDRPFNIVAANNSILIGSPYVGEAIPYGNEYVIRWTDYGFCVSGVGASSNNIACPTSQLYSIYLLTDATKKQYVAGSDPESYAYFLGSANAKQGSDGKYSWLSGDAYVDNSRISLPTDENYYLLITKVGTAEYGISSSAFRFQAAVQGRDSRRLADVRQMAAALELYFNDFARYPVTLALLAPDYIGAIPIAPSPADGACSVDQNTYTYTPSANGWDYTLKFCLGAHTSGYQAGARILSKTGIK